MEHRELRSNWPYLDLVKIFSAFFLVVFLLYLCQMLARTVWILHDKKKSGLLTEVFSSSNKRNY